LRAALTQFTSSKEPNEDMSDIDIDESIDDNSKETGEVKNPLIRKGIIDLESIDENKDGKVYQDLMDWNVISDEPGRCIICNMELRELPLEKAKENLLENGFKVK